MQQEPIFLGDQDQANLRCRAGHSLQPLQDTPHLTMEAAGALCLEERMQPSTHRDASQNKRRNTFQIRQAESIRASICNLRPTCAKWLFNFAGQRLSMVPAFDLLAGWRWPGSATRGMHTVCLLLSLCREYRQPPKPATNAARDDHGRPADRALRLRFQPRSWDRQQDFP
jgi:hypothetical protein